jgi:TolB-like protein
MVKLMGDGALVEFASAVDAVRCAVHVQRAVTEAQAVAPDDRRIAFRIGINVGDVIADGEDLYGEGVNVAARLEALAEPGGICVSGLVRDSVRNNLDAVFVDLGERRVKNIAEPVRVFRIDVGQGPRATPALAPEIESILERPAVAVLPFVNLSGDPGKDYFADGLTEDLITALARWRWFPVIARNSTFAYKGQSRDVRRVASELGARYVLEGSVRKSGNRLRVTAQLIDAKTGHHVWAERYDRGLVDMFDVQDEITELIAGIIAPELERAERKHPVEASKRNLDAWDYLKRGMSQLYTYTKEGNVRARELLERAVEIDPNYARAHAAIAISHFTDVRWGFTASVNDRLPYSKPQSHSIPVMQSWLTGWDTFFVLAAGLRLPSRCSKRASSSVRVIPGTQSISISWHAHSIRRVATRMPSSGRKGLSAGGRQRAFP